MMKHSKRQDEILNASIEIISERGIQGLTIKNISEKIGITEPAIYRHFKNKLAILVSILNLFKVQTEDSYKNINTNDSSLFVIERIFDDHIKRFSPNPHLASVIFAEEIFRNSIELSEIVFKIMSVNIDNLKYIIELGQKNGEIRDDVDARELSFIILGSLRFMIKSWVQSGFSYNIMENGESLKKSIVNLIKSIEK